MGSSRASTPAGRRRAAKRASAVGQGSRGRARAQATGGAKPGAAVKPKPKSKPKPKRAAAAPPSKPRPKPKTKPKPKPQRKRSWADLARHAPRIALWLLAVGVILAAVYFAWFRNSSFVAVEDLRIEGAQGPEAEAIEAALTKSASEMTTLNVDRGALEKSVAGFATVTGIDFDADLPHGLTIDVTGRPPVMVATSGERSVAVAADGTILNGVDASKAGVPDVKVGEIPAQGKLAGDDLALATVAGAAPVPLQPLIGDVTFGEKDGITVTLEGGIPVYFGESSRAGEKWDAVSAILADPKVETLSHLDVRVPERPSIGGAAPPIE